MTACSVFAALGRRRVALHGPSRSLQLCPPHDGRLRAWRWGGGRRERADRRINADCPHDRIQTAISTLMARPDRPDGIICGNVIAALSVTAGAEAAGLVLGRDFEVVVKESLDLFRKFRPAIETAHEDFRFAGRWLAETIVGRIEGTADVAAHYYLDVPRLGVPRPGVTGEVERV